MPRSEPQPPAGAGRDTQAGLAFLDQLGLDAALAAIGERQHAVMSLDQIRALGISGAAVRLRVSVRRLHRIHHTVYSLVPPSLLSREGRWFAAVLACGPGAVLSHQSAAALLALRPYNGTKIDVTVPLRSSRRHADVRLHRSTTLIDDDTTAGDSIPCTTVARTLLDLADVLGRRGLERAFDQAEVNRVFDLTAIQDQLERNRGRRRATGLVKLVLNEHYLGSTPTWNILEERLLGISRSAGARDPEVNQWLVLPDGGPAIQPDFMWRKERLVIETDGRKTHKTRQTFESDRLRDQRLTAAGWRVVRVTWRQVFRRPNEVRALIVQLLQHQASYVPTTL